MLLTIADVLALIPVARSTLYLLMQESDFPQPIRVRGRVFWKREEIYAYIDAKQERGRASCEHVFTVLTPATGSSYGKCVKCGRVADEMYAKQEA